MKRVIATLLAAMLLGLVPAAQAEAKTFKNCSDLRKNYKYGVSLSRTILNKSAGPIFTPKSNATVFRLNKRLDTDRDNIVCEVVRPKPAPLPTSAPIASGPPAPSEPAFEAPSELTDSVDQCRIQEVSKVRGMTGAGFPEWNSLTPKTGTVKWALIPIDFSDVPGERNFRPRVDEQMLLLSEWIANASGGRLKVEWVVLDKWATLPGKSTDYVIPRSANVNDAPNGPKLFRDAMKAADPLFDFSNIQTVNFILPRGQSFLGESSQGFPWDAVVKEVTTNEGKVSSYSIAGQFFDQPGREYWSYWAHEFGHAIGLPHVGTNSGHPPFNAWDLMGSQDGPSRELSGWLRFIAGWLSNEQVYCKDAMKAQALTLTLVPVSSLDPGVKLAVLPLTKTKALLIESRRETKFSCRTSPRQDGLLVYVYDSTLGHFQDFLMPVTPSGRQNSSTSCNAPPSLDSLLRRGDKVLIEGLTIELLKSDRFDKISITRN